MVTADLFAEGHASHLNGVSWWSSLCFRSSPQTLLPVHPPCRPVFALRTQRDQGRRTTSSWLIL